MPKPPKAEGPDNDDQGAEEPGASAPGPEEIVNAVLKRVSDGSIEREQRRARRLRVIAIGAVILIIALAIANAPQDHAPDLSGATDALTTLEANGATHVHVPANRDGHYVFKGAINGVTVKFALDTGAGLVIVSQDLATHLQLRPGSRIEVSTTAGVTDGYSTELNRVAVGGIAAHAVRAAIVPQLPDDRALLGMSFLRGLEVRQKNNVLTLIQAAP